MQKHYQLALEHTSKVSYIVFVRKKSFGNEKLKHKFTGKSYTYRQIVQRCPLKSVLIPKQRPTITQSIQSPTNSN